MTRPPTKPIQPTQPPRLNVPRSTAQQKLEAHLEKGRELAKRVITSELDMDKADGEGDKWRDYAITLLSTLFDTSTISDEFRDKTRQITFGGSSHFLEERESFKDRISNWWIKELESIAERLDLIPESLVVHQNISPANVIIAKDLRTEALEKVELIANRFHIVTRQLKQRHSNRSTLTIADEYDVQDLFHSLLRLYFDDIRDEEWTPSYAGGASRIDFLLKAEQIVIELKMTRQGMSVKDVSNQLIIDTDRYQIHPDCKTLIAFVYDPQEYLNNPRGIERDLTKTVNGVPVKVIINPR